MYYENVDACGVYWADNEGAPPSQPYFFLVRYTGSGLLQGDCPDGSNFRAFEFMYKRGSPNNSPFFYGLLRTQDGRADGNGSVTVRR